MSTIREPRSERATTTMRAVGRERYGSADGVEVRTVDRPTVGPDEVLVEVHAAGLDRGVWHLMTGTPHLLRLAGFGLIRPKQPTLGFDVAGRVIDVGEDVTRFVPGDVVFGIAQGSFAELAVAKEAKLVAKPDGVDLDQAAVATISGITALQALTTVGGVQAGQRVLVVGASGGVGSFAVQLAQALGATVTGVAGPRNQDFVRSLGADAVIDHTTDALDHLDERFDLVLDIGGGNRLSRLRRVLTPTGTLVIVGGEGRGRVTGGVGRQLRAVVLSVFTRQRLTFFISEESLRFIEPLADHLARGDVVPAVEQRVGLDGVADALRQMGAGTLRGKTAVIVDPEPAPPA